MALDVQIKRIPALVGTIGNYQICIEPTNDPDLGIKLMGYKDAAGNPFKLLVKDHPAKVLNLVISSFGSAGYVKNTTLGVLTGGNSIDPADVPDHDDLNGLSGGTTGEYYHLTTLQEQQVDLITGNLDAKQILFSSSTGFIVQSAKFTFDGTKKLFAFGVVPKVWASGTNVGWIQFPGTTNVMGIGVVNGNFVHCASHYIDNSSNPIRSDAAVSTMFQQRGDGYTFFVDNYQGEAADTIITDFKNTLHIEYGKVELNTDQDTNGFKFIVRAENNINGLTFDSKTGHINWMSAVITDWSSSPKYYVLQLPDAATDERIALYSIGGLEVGIVKGAYFSEADARWNRTKATGFFQRICTVASDVEIQAINYTSGSQGDEVVWDDGNVFVVSGTIGTHVNFYGAASPVGDFGVNGDWWDANIFKIESTDVRASFTRWNNDVNPYLIDYKKLRYLENGTIQDGADGDGIITFSFVSHNDTPAEIEFTKIESKIVDASAGNETASYIIYNRVNGAYPGLLPMFAIVNKQIGILTDAPGQNFAGHGGNFTDPCFHFNAGSQIGGVLISSLVPVLILGDTSGSANKRMFNITLGGKGGVESVGTYNIIELQDDFSETGDNIKFESELGHPHYALNRSSHDHWNTDYFVLSFGKKSAPTTLYQTALYQDRTGNRMGLITQGGLYDYTDDRWEGGVDSSRPAMLAIWGEVLYYKLARASVNEEDAIDWIDVLALDNVAGGVRTTLFSFTNENDDFFPCSIMSNKTRISGGVIQAGQDNDWIGSLPFVSRNDAVAPESITYGYFNVYIADASDGIESIRYELKGYALGATYNFLTIENSDWTLYNQDNSTDGHKIYIRKSRASLDDITEGDDISSIIWEGRVSSAWSQFAKILVRDLEPASPLMEIFVGTTKLLSLDAAKIVSEETLQISGCATFNKSGTAFITNDLYMASGKVAHINTIKAQLNNGDLQLFIEDSDIGLTLKHSNGAALFDVLKTPVGSHPTNYEPVFANTDTGEIYAYNGA